MVDGYDPAAFDVVREEYSVRDDSIDFREDWDYSTQDRPNEPRTVQERYDAGLLRGSELERYERWARNQGRDLEAERDARRRINMEKRLLERIANDDSIVLTPEMVEVINDPEIRLTSNGEITRKTGRDIIRSSGQFSRQNLLPSTILNSKSKKKKRKVSNYQKQFGKMLKDLKKKHPRTKVQNLMKRAHKLTRKSMKK